MPEVEPPPTVSEMRRAATVSLTLTAGFLLFIGWLNGGTDADYPGWWVAPLVLIPFIIGGIFSSRVPYTAQPLDPELDALEAHLAARKVFAEQTVRKLIYMGASLLPVVALTFILDHGAWPLIMAGPIGFIVMTVVVWPSLRNVSITATVLESAGAKTGLTESYV